MTKRELKDYYAWFKDVLPQRMDELSAAVKATPGFTSWEQSYTPESLNILGEWFALQVETRTRTANEMDALCWKDGTPIAGISNQELTNRTFSIAFDVGMYLSQVFLKACPSLHWGQRLTAKKNIDYGQPVIEGFGVLSFNPVHMVVVLAYGIARGVKSGDGLRKLYDIWVKMVVS